MEGTHPQSVLSPKAVGRLSLYRRLLSELEGDGTTHIFSHELAAMTGGTGAQVRRDMMLVGYTGSPTRGYTVHDLLTSIGAFLDSGSASSAVVIGVGNLGRALLAYFSSRATGLDIVAAFDTELSKVNRVIAGCRCYPLEMLAEILDETKVEIAVLAVPAQAAIDVATLLYEHGVRGFVNFAPVHLHLPDDAFVEQIDLTMALDKAAFFGHATAEHKESYR